MIGKNIYSIRKEKGYRYQIWLKEQIFAKSYLSNIERNINKNPSVHLITRVADVLGVDLLVLISDKKCFHWRTNVRGRVDFICK